MKKMLSAIQTSQDLSMTRGGQYFCGRVVYSYYGIVSNYQETKLGLPEIEFHWYILHFLNF